MCFAKQVSSKPFEITGIPFISSWKLRFQLNASEKGTCLASLENQRYFFCISNPLSPHFLLSFIFFFKAQFKIKLV